MSRIGEMPVPVPSGVDLRLEGRRVTVKGPRGELRMELPEAVGVTVEGGRAVVARERDTRRGRAMHGLTRSLLNNMVTGVTQGYTRELTISGVGFRAAVEGSTLTMTVGFSRPVVYAIPEGVSVSVDGAGTGLTVAGCDKQQVGEVAARIRGFCPAEPYKGKGIQYRDERIRRKVGKTVA